MGLSRQPETPRDEALVFDVSTQMSEDNPRLLEAVLAGSFECWKDGGCPVSPRLVTVELSNVTVKHRKLRETPWKAPEVVLGQVLSAFHIAPPHSMHRSVGGTNVV